MEAFRVRLFALDPFDENRPFPTIRRIILVPLDDSIIASEEISTRTADTSMA